MVVYGKRDSIQGRSLVVIGNPASPLSCGSLDINLPISADVASETVAIDLPAGFNAQEQFNNSFEAYLCYNNYPPVFLAASFEQTISEDTPIGKVIDKHIATDDDAPLPAGNIRYSLTFLNETQKGLLSIDPVTGNISVAESLDRESYPSIETLIVATDQGPHIYIRRSASATFILNLNDVNDNAPIPGKAIYVMNINESTIVPSKPLITVTATDKDIDASNRITGGDNVNPFFQINATTGAVRLVRSLDRETEPFYNLTIQITDSLTNPLTSYTYIEVTVLDSNDNRPVFTSVDEITILENNDVGAFLLNVTATDADIGTNAQLTFSVPAAFQVDSNNAKQVGAPNLNNYFHIDPISGELTAQQMLDRETIFKYQITLQVFDGIDPPTAQFLYLSVCEENDNAPTFDSTLYTWTVYENSVNGTLVNTLVATDDDEGSFCTSDTDNDQDNAIHYFLTSSNISEFFVEQTTGNVRVNASIDYENVKNFTLDIFAEDLGVPSLNGTTRVLIEVLDVNDNYPIFLQSNYTDSVVENSTIGTVLQGVHIQATDADSTSNSEIRYIISDGVGKDDFSTDSTTGIITVARTLDRETIAVYDLVVTAYDLGTPSLSSNVSVTVTVLDINDSPPVFLDREYFQEQSENVPIGTTIMTVRAVDADEGNDRLITYAPLLNLDGNNPLPFAINQSNGDIYTIRSLCTLMNVSYNFNITAQDKPGGTLLFEANVTAHVLVYDDNSDTPTFERPELVVQIPDGSPNGTVLGTFTANDDDVCSHPLVYSLLPVGNHADIHFNNSTAVLTSLVDLDKDQQHLYTVTVHVSDGNTLDTRTSTAVVVPVEFSSNRGFPIADPVRDSTSVFSKNYSYFHDAYSGTSGRLTTTFSNFN